MYVYIETTYKIPCHFNKMEKKSPKLKLMEPKRNPKSKNNLESKEQQWSPSGFLNSKQKRMPQNCVPPAIKEADKAVNPKEGI